MYTVQYLKWRLYINLYQLMLIWMTTFHVKYRHGMSSNFANLNLEYIWMSLPVSDDVGTLNELIVFKIVVSRVPYTYGEVLRFIADLKHIWVSYGVTYECVWAKYFDTSFWLVDYGGATVCSVINAQKRISAEATLNNNSSYTSLSLNEFLSFKAKIST